MAGNIQADNSGNILVEFDYNNIIVVDPNKTIDDFGKVSERLVDHEKLVMYANLEAELLPRTKLAVGGAPEDRIKTISVAKMNFLKPTKNSYLGTGYYDELTGENSTQFKGPNQLLEKGIQPINGEKPYIVNTVANEKDIIDNGLLGITSINIQTNSSFIPTVEILLEDVQGRGLFELGNNSPYSAFFNLPYPPFYLTLKGYYGQAIRYQLNLEKFHASFNGFSGNYLVRLQFKGYKFNILNEVAMGHLLAAPHMYSQRFDVTQSVEGPQQSNRSAESQANTQAERGANNLGSSQAAVTQLVAERGYQKIVEVYSEYKAKGLIAPNFPELTLVQLMNKLDQFEQTIVESFDKTEVESLTNIRNYKGILTQYFGSVRGANTSWFNTYLDPNPIVLVNKQKIYTFKDLSTEVKEEAISILQSNITKFNASLAENPTLGTAGPTPIPNPIKYDIIKATPPPFDSIDWRETTRIRTGILSPTVQDEADLKNRLTPLFVTTKLQLTETNGNKSLVPIPENFFTFESEDGFDKQIGLLETQANKKLSDYESEISEKLLRKIEDTDVGLGFKPTVRNMIAPIMASAEAFIRLLDDVHTSAWNVKYDPVRKSAILDNQTSAQGSEVIDLVVRDQSNLVGNNELDNNAVNSQIPVYPWPQFFVESPDDKKGRFQLKYIADPTVVDLTQGYLFDKWPEVEFVEEYMRGLTQKFQSPTAPPPLDSERDTDIININAIEFPSTGVAYTNKEEIKFFYEIWERQFLTTHYSNLIRANSNQIDELFRLNTETEYNNISKKLGVSSPYLNLKLKNYNLTASNYPTFLKDISNTGTGRAYQEYTRDFFVTPYIKGLTENSFSILSTTEIGKIPQSTAKSEALKILISNASNDPLIIDTIPYTNQTWCVNNLNQGNTASSNQVYNTRKSLTIFEPRKVISNFNDVYNYTFNRPVTNFSYILGQNPTSTAISLGVTNSGLVGLNAFYLTRTPNNFIPTEGFVNGISPTNGINFQSTTSMLNTPYFVNAIQNGVYNSRLSGNTYPYVQAAYLFLNSLPLATLREKYKSLDNNLTTELDFISATFKKFGAVHKLPYAWILKYGSIWYRYKRYKESNVDILSSAWSDFNYAGNYNPITSSVTQTYSFKYSNVDRNITLQNEGPTQIQMQVGFYPKLINDFNVFYNGYDLYVNYTDQEIQNSVNGGLKLYNFRESNIVSATQNGKNLQLSTWSVLLPNLLPDSPIECNPKDNTVGGDYFIVPSFGTPFNQTTNACISDITTSPRTVVNLTNNPSVFNGSVRSLWSAPNFGYFDSDQIQIPSPDSYLNLIVQQGDQTPFNLLTEDNYTKIEEVFSVFEKKILDSFESEFLNFCRRMTDVRDKSSVTSFGISPVSVNANFRNFQSLFKSLMTVPVKTGSESEDQYFTNTINNQFSLFQVGITAFMEYDVIFRFGNPSNYQRRIFDSYLSHNSTEVVVDPISFEPYVPNSLPTLGGGVTLQQSQIANQDAWEALETEVGFSTITNLRYTSAGSYITDFFVDNNIAFTSQNVVLLAPLIKMYATQKLNNPNINSSSFQNQLSTYLGREDDIQDVFLNGVLESLRANLSDQVQLPERVVKSVISGEQSKVENYEVFKALNDKWIAGGDYKTKTLFEDFLFMDRASRNIGDTILIDIFELKNMFSENSLNQAMSVFTFIGGILIKNNFTVMPLPAYVNFYNVQDVDGVSSPKPEGSLQFANSLWGTFLDVDYRNSGPKMICFYTGKPSQYLNLPKQNSRFRDDAFEMRRASDNPLIEDQQGKKDWALSNKCVGFNVDVGTRNQNIFYSFTVSQDNGVATSESINTQLNMVDQASGRAVATQNNSLFNLYKQRSYKCSVVSLGNALLQPTMYFNLRHVPMFNGPYMITDVSHSIQPGTFQTTFNGVRQGVYDLPAIDSFLQSINQNLITRLEEILKINKDQVTVSGTTNNIKSDSVVQKADNTLDTTNSCNSKLDSVYLNASLGYEAVNGTATEVSPEEFAAVLKRIAPNDEQLQTIIYCISYIRTFQVSSNTKLGKFYAWNNNLATLSLDVNWAGQVSLLPRTYSCINVKTTDSKSTSLPITHFSSLDDYVRFMAGKLRPRVSEILKPGMGLSKYYVCLWPQKSIDLDYYDQNKSRFAQTEQTFFEALASAVRVGLINADGSTKLKEGIKKDTNNSTAPNVTPTPSPVVGCPPPAIKSFSPSAGYIGTIIQLNGTNFESIKSITVAGQAVNPTTIRVFNPQTLRFTLPDIIIPSGQNLVQGKIVITTDSGVSETPLNFTFNPALVNVSLSSPGGYENTDITEVVSVPQQEVIGENMNPQQTGQPTFIDTTIQLNESKTQSLNVKINPELSGWVIGATVDQNAQVYVLEESNNQVTRKKVTQKIQGVGGQVTNNEFNITLSEIESFYLDGVPRIEGKTQIDIIFTVYAYKGEGSPVKQQFPFRIWYTLPNQNQVPIENIPVNQTLPTFPQQQLSIVRLPDSNTLQGDGQTYYNIEKPSGGYITFNFTLPSGQSYQSQNLGGISILDNNYGGVPFNSFGNSSTRYTNQMTINSKGVFRLQIKYYPYGFTSPIGGEVLEQIVVSDIFTL